MIEIGSRIKKFTYTGATQYFTVPANITTIYVSACGGGGGGGNYSVAGSGGGATSMGTAPSILFTLAGGGGGGSYGSGVTGASGGWGGQPGISDYIGGSTIFGVGGVKIATTPYPGTGYGSGGAGKDQGNSGGGAACYLKQPVSVTPGATYPITVGSPGSGASGAASGAEGFVLIEW